MIKYNKVSPKIKGEIKRAYEAGVDLIDLAIKYTANYGTLRNIASKEEWVKGKSKSILQQAIIEDDISKRVELRNQVIGHYQNLHQSNLSYLMKLERTEERPKVKAQEEALKHRIQATAELYKLAKELFSIQTPTEKVEHELRQMRYEMEKKLIESNEGVMFLRDLEEI